LVRPNLRVSVSLRPRVSTNSQFKCTTAYQCWAIAYHHLRSLC